MKTKYKFDILIRYTDKYHKRDLTAKQLDSEVFVLGEKSFNADKIQKLKTLKGFVGITGKHFIIKRKEVL